MNPAISARNLSKCYRLGVIGRKTLADEVRYWWLKFNGHDPYTYFSKIGQTIPKTQMVEAEREGQKRFWALKDVSFDVQPGEVVGIIGRNGAGKSMLLKILTRITEPTLGEAIIYGRVASLLEVGTGFHPELTGRENIYMNGTILGMKKREIDAKFDEILDFSELEQFVDTPVKRYSSGMYVRLAFAVAAHLEPEILLIDEVLAVGDEQFQKKCLGKMESVGRAGRTVLFVSHQMSAITQLCNRAILLSHGQVIKDGKTQEVIDHYLEKASTHNKDGFMASENSSTNMYIERIQTLNADGTAMFNFSHNEPIIISVQCKINRWMDKTVLGFYVCDQRGRKVFTCNNPLWGRIDSQSRWIHSSVKIPANFLAAGRYFFTFTISIPYIEVVDSVSDAVAIVITDAGSDHLSAVNRGHDHGCVFANCEWNIRAIY
jgi:lipopolysaccharide transport system ATP-binding protein